MLIKLLKKRLSFKIPIMFYTITTRLMLSIASIHRTTFVCPFIERIAILSKSFIMHRAKPMPFVRPLTTICRTYRFFFGGGFVCTAKLFKPSIMQRAKSVRFMLPFASLDRAMAACIIMINKMFPIRGIKLKIFNSVIGRILIKVVDYFPREKFTFKMILHNNSMFKLPNSISFNFNIQPFATIVGNTCSLWFSIVTASALLNITHVYCLTRKES